jgi:hypothetical protein
MENVIFFVISLMYIHFLILNIMLFQYSCILNATNNFYVCISNSPFHIRNNFAYIIDTQYVTLFKIK